MSVDFNSADIYWASSFSLPDSGIELERVFAKLYVHYYVHGFASLMVNNILGFLLVHTHPTLL